MRSNIRLLETESESEAEEEDEPLLIGNAPHQSASLYYSTGEMEHLLKLKTRYSYEGTNGMGALPPNYVPRSRNICTLTGQRPSCCRRGNGNMLDKWCSQKTPSSRIVYAIILVLLISAVVAFVCWAGLAALSLTEQKKIEKVPVLGGGSSAQCTVAAAASIVYSPAGTIKVVYSNSAQGISYMSNNTYLYSLTDWIPDLQDRERSLTSYFPFSANSLALLYNIPNATQNPPLNISREVLVAIFSGNITRWNHPFIQFYNPHWNPLPDLHITPLHRQDAGSGSNAVMIYILCSFSQTNRIYKWSNCFPYNRQLGAFYDIWPVPDPPGVTITSEQGFLRAVQSIPGSIGFPLLGSVTSALNSTIFSDDFGYAQLQNQDGNFILPSLQNLQTIVASTPMNPSPQTHSFEYNILDMANCSFCYPISNWGYIGFRSQLWDLQCSPSTKSFAAFLKWFYSEAIFTSRSNNPLPQLLLASSSVTLNKSNANLVLHQLAALDPCPDVLFPFSESFVAFTLFDSFLLVCSLIVGLYLYCK